MCSVENESTYSCSIDGSCRFAWLKEGEYDSSGRKVEQILYVERAKYIIYFVEKDYLKAYYIDDYGFQANFTSDFQQALSDVRSFNVKNKKKNEFIRQTIASAYFNALNGYESVAVRELISLSSKLLYQTYVWWIVTYIICCVGLVATCIILMLMSDYIRINELVYGITSSCIGSLLVYSQKEKTVVTRHYLPVIDSMIRFFSSAISGFLVYCILKSNLLLGAFSESTFGIILVCFIAGYSEDVPLKLLGSISGIIVTEK